MVHDADIQMPRKETPIVIPSWCGAAQATVMDQLERRAGIASSRWDRWTRAGEGMPFGILEGASRFNERWGHRCVWDTTLTDVENYPFGSTWGWKIHVVAQDRNSLAYSLIVVFMFPSHFFCRLPFSSQDKSLSSNGGPKVIQKLACLCRENHWFTVRKPQMCLGMWGQNFKARQVKVFRNLCQTIDGNPFVALCCSKLATVTIWLVSVYI